MLFGSLGRAVVGFGVVAGRLGDGARWHVECIEHGVVGTKQRVPQVCALTETADEAQHLIVDRRAACALQRRRQMR